MEEPLIKPEEEKTLIYEEESVLLTSKADMKPE
jgi:hypothetical protein